ncbi:MAG: thioredoxin family protein [bacterium]|nr:thioredoxin family protein [bacterium]
MKTKLSLGLFSVILFAGSFTFAALPDFSSIVFPWLSAEGLTKYSVETDFRGQDAITRGEASKFVVQYAMTAGLEKNYTQCDFTDLEGYDETLVPFIMDACAYGLLKGSDGKFMPNENITEDQAITVVIRSLEGFKDETQEPRYAEYFARGKTLGMIDSETEASVAATKITRAKLGGRFYVAAQVDTDTILDSQNEEELTKLLEETMNELFNDDTGQSEQETTQTTAMNGYFNYNADDLTTALDVGQDVVLFFYTTSCSSLCQTANTALVEETDFPDNVTIFRVDYDTATDLKSKYNVTSQHTFVQLNADMSAKATRQDSEDLADIISHLE